MDILSRAQHFIPDAVYAEPLGKGSINHTFMVTSRSGDRFVLQRMSGLFAPELQEDIGALTPVLRAAGVLVPEYLPTTKGEHALVEAEGWWRMMSYLDGEIHVRAPSDAHALSAARLLARFERALWDIEHEFTHVLPHFQEFGHYDAQLARALKTPVADGVLARFVPLLEQRRALTRAVAPEQFAELPRRIVHGDPKMTNFLFVGEKASGLIDLDTIGARPLSTDIGDLLRSACRVESQQGHVTFSADRATKILNTYVEELPPLTTAERDSLPRSVAYVALNLATRYLADAIEGTYFVHKKERFATHADQCLHEAGVQLGVCEEALAWAASYHHSYP